MFNGQTGAEMATVDYCRRAARSARGATATATASIASWPARLPRRQRPELHHGARLLHAHDVMAAWNWRGGALTQLWKFDSNSSAQTRPATPARATQLTVANVDDDGQEEIVYGAMAIDDNGAGLCSTGYNHGDAKHVGDSIPSRPASRCSCATRTATSRRTTSATRAPAQILWSTDQRRRHRPLRRRRHLGRQPGRRDRGRPAPTACSRPPSGQPRAASRPRTNFLVWWDADETRELLDGTPHRQVRHRRRHPAADRARRALEQRHQVDADADRRPPRRLARGGDLARDATTPRCASTRRRPRRRGGSTR